MKNYVVIVTFTSGKIGYFIIRGENPAQASNKFTGWVDQVKRSFPGSVFHEMIADKQVVHGVKLYDFDE